MNNFVPLLKSRHRNDDKALFTRWMNKEITTDRAIEEFKMNNHMKNIIINSNEFESWLFSLGYKRSKI